MTYADTQALIDESADTSWVRTRKRPHVKDSICRLLVLLEEQNKELEAQRQALEAQREREETLWTMLWKGEQADGQRENDQRRRIEAARANVAVDKDRFLPNLQRALGIINNLAKSRWLGRRTATSSIRLYYWQWMSCRFCHRSTTKFQRDLAYWNDSCWSRRSLEIDRYVGKGEQACNSVRYLVGPGCKRVPSESDIQEREKLQTMVVEAVCPYQHREIRYPCRETRQVSRQRYVLEYT